MKTLIKCESCEYTTLDKSNFARHLKRFLSHELLLDNTIGKQNKSEFKAD